MPVSGPPTGAFSCLVRSALGGAVLATLVAAPVAWAASDGTIGSTSTGNLTITVTIDNLVQVTGFADMAFGTYTGAGNLQDTNNLCVFSTTRGYNVTATSDTGAFTLAGGAIDTIPYAVTWDDSGNIGAAGATVLTHNTLAVGFATDATSTTCAGVGGATAVLTVDMTEANLLAAAADTYQSVLTVVVGPE